MGKKFASYWRHTTQFDTSNAQSLILPLFHHLLLCQSRTYAAHHKSIKSFVLTLRWHCLSDCFTHGTERVHIRTFLLAVCSPNQISLFRPTMRSLFKAANNNTCSTESQDVSLKLTQSLVQRSSDSTHMQQLFQKIPLSNNLPPLGDVLLRGRSLR